MSAVHIPVSSSGRHVVRREHNSKLIVTLPGGASAGSHVDGEQWFKQHLLFRSMKHPMLLSCRRHDGWQEILHDCKCCSRAHQQTVGEWRYYLKQNQAGCERRNTSCSPSSCLSVRGVLSVIHSSSSLNSHYRLFFEVPVFWSRGNAVTAGRTMFRPVFSGNAGGSTMQVLASSQ